jgi:hypothetical protein
MWAVEVDIDKPAKPALAREAMCGYSTSYPQCQAEARRLRDAGAHAVIAPSAALAPRSAGGYRVERGFQSGPPRDGSVFVLFGRRPDAVGWLVVDDGRPPVEILTRVRGWIRSS